MTLTLAIVLWLVIIAAAIAAGFWIHNGRG